MLNKAKVWGKALLVIGIIVGIMVGMYYLTTKICEKIVDWFYPA